MCLVVLFYGLKLFVEWTFFGKKLSGDVLGDYVLGVDGHLGGTYLIWVAVFLDVFACILQGVFAA